MARLARDFPAAPPSQRPLRRVADVPTASATGQCRLAIELLRVIGPSALNFAAMFLIALATLKLLKLLPLSLLFLTLPAVYLAAGVLVTLVVAALKWLVVGRYRPRVRRSGRTSSGGRN